MFLPVALKHKEVDFSGLPVARRPSHRRHSGDSVVMDRGSFPRRRRSGRTAAPCG